MMTSLLLASLLRPCALVAAAWLLLRLLRIRHPASQHAVWTAVLAGMLVAPVAPQWEWRVLPHAVSQGVEWRSGTGMAGSEHALRESAPFQSDAQAAEIAPAFGWERPLLLL